MKKILSLLLALTFILSLAACGGDKSDTVSANKPDLNSSVTDPSADNSEKDQTENNEPVLPENIYEGEKFELYCKFADATGNIKVADATGNYVVDEQGIVFSSDNGEKAFSEMSPAGYVIANNKIYTKNAEGYIIIKESGREYICSDIKGDIFYTFKGMLDGSLYVFSVDGKGDMYLNSFKQSGHKDDYDNEPFYIYDTKDKTLHRTVEKIVVTDTLNPKIYAEIGNKTFYDNVTGTMKVDGKQCFFFSSLSYEFDKIFDFGYENNMTSPIFSKKDSDTALYFRKGWGSDEFSVKLPEGYKVSDIKDVVFAFNTAVFMKDGTVWTGQLQYDVMGTTLSKHEKLSDVSSHIISVHSSNYTSENSLIVLMDDNKLYQANF